ncbi:hypothetical protein R6Q57_001044 [Mikania cordata]
MSVQARNQKKGVDTKRNKLGIPNPLWEVHPVWKNGLRRRSFNLQKLGSMCRKTQLLVVTKKDRTFGIKSEVNFSKPWVVGVSYKRYDL